MTYGEEPLPIDFKEVNAKELTILGTRHQYQKFPESIQYLSEHRKQIDHLITHVIPIDKYEEAFSVLEEKEGNAGKVILTW